MRRKSDLPVKPCTVCERPMVWRRKWARDWQDVKYCSARCRRTGRLAARSAAGQAQPDRAARR